MAFHLLSRTHSRCSASAICGIRCGPWCFRVHFFKGTFCRSELRCTTYSLDILANFSERLFDASLPNQPWATVAHRVAQNPLRRCYQYLASASVPRDSEHALRADSLVSSF